MRIVCRVTLLLRCEPWRAFKQFQLNEVNASVCGVDVLWVVDGASTESLPVRGRTIMPSGNFHIQGAQLFCIACIHSNNVMPEVSVAECFTTNAQCLMITSYVHPIDVWMGASE
eukprot:1154602-Pelagomonas_calceolata.AAC.2